jgi:hypothetical protein
MTTEWVITAAAEQVELKSDNTGETAFTVTNPGSTPDVVVYEAVPGDGTDVSWFPPPPEPQVQVAAGGSVTFLQKIAVAAGAPAGSYSFQCRAYSADTAPEEGSRLSARVAFEVKPSVKKKKPWWPYAVAAGVVVVVLAVVGILVFSGGGDEFDPTVKPTLMSPADGAVFSNFPRTTNYQWQAVPGATQYRLQIQFCQAACTDANAANWRAPRLTAGTTFTDDFVGAQPGRWRVTAIGPSGDGATSEWRQFRYTV